MIQNEYCLSRSRGQLGDLHASAFLFDQHIEVRIDDLGIQIGDLCDIGIVRVAVDDRGRPGKADERELLLGILSHRLRRDIAEGSLCLVERTSAARLLGHRVAVVEQYEVVCRRRSKQRQPLLLRNPLGGHRNDQRDGRHPHQQQEELLQPNPPAMLFIAAKQKFHRGPLHPVTAHQVDQVDQQGNQREQESPG